MTQEPLPRWDGPLSHPFYSHVVKRALDFLFALILLIPGLLLMIPLAVWVKLDSPGPVIYRAPRGGYHNKTFMIMKFRSMVVGADKTGGTTALNDSRVTRAGRVMRRLKLDELPQLFNILLLRDPLLIQHLAQDELLGTENPVENYEKYILPEKNRLRVEYALNQSFSLDVRLFFETLGGVFGKAKKMQEEHKEHHKEEAR